MINLDSVSNQLLFVTVRLRATMPDGSEQTSTAFIVNMEAPGKQQVPLLVTCKHAVVGARSVSLSCVQGSPSIGPELGKYETYTLDSSLLNLIQVGVADVAAIPFAPILNHASQQGQNLFFRNLGLELFAKDEDLPNYGAIEDVTFVGYPKGLHDTKNLLPIVRRGITASPLWNDYEGRGVFLIDAEVFPGSSGSPVFLFNEGAYSTKGGINIGNRLVLVGMVTRSLNDPATRQHIGLGEVLSAKVIRTYLNDVLRALSLKAPA